MAVDAGNSKTDLAVVALDGQVLGRLRTKGFRPELGEARALEGLRQALVQVVDQVGLAGRSATAWGLFLANADLPAQEQRFAAAAGGWGGTKRVHVANDTFALLRSGLSGPVGAAVVCGAGTNAIAIGPEGQVGRLPALGALTGDWGGGAGLARAALWAACRAEDGRGGPTALATRIADHFHADSATTVGIDLSLGLLPGSRLYEVVPLLFAVARAGDAVAAALLDRQAEEIARLAVVVLGRAGLLGEPTELVLGGGVLAAREEPLHQRVLAALADQVPAARPVFPAGSPLAGAVLATLELDTGSVAADVAARVRAQFDPAAPDD